MYSADEDDDATRRERARDVSESRRDQEADWLLERERERDIIRREHARNIFCPPPAPIIRPHKDVPP